VFNRMVSIPMTLNYLEGHFSCLKPFWILYLAILPPNLIPVLARMCLYTNWKMYVYL